MTRDLGLHGRGWRIAVSAAGPYLWLPTHLAAPRTSGIRCHGLPGHLSITSVTIYQFRRDIPDESDKKVVITDKKLKKWS